VLHLGDDDPDAAASSSSFSPGTLAWNAAIASSIGFLRLTAVAMSAASTTAAIIRRQLFHQEGRGLVPLVEVVEVDLLVGRVEVVVVEADPHEHRRHLEHPVEGCDDGDRAPLAREHRRLAERPLHGARGGLECDVVGGCEPARAVVEVGDLHLDRLRRDLLDELLELLEDLRCRLIGNEAHRHFACASAGITVFAPSPWKPPQIPLISSVGRARDPLDRREPGSPNSAGASIDFLNFASEWGSLAISFRSFAVSFFTLS
jgi:hypothetical protein